MSNGNAPIKPKTQTLDFGGFEVEVEEQAELTEEERAAEYARLVPNPRRMTQEDLDILEAFERGRAVIIRDIYIDESIL